MWQTLLTWTGLQCFATQKSTKSDVCPKVRIRVQGREVLALVDSGSEVSLMPESLYREIRNDLTPLPRARINLKAANGENFSILETVKANVRLHSRTSREAEMHVVRTLSQKDYVILGADFMQRNNISLDMGRRKLKIGKACTLNRPERPIKIVGKISISPRSETVWTGYVPNGQEGDEVLVEGASFPEGIVPIDGISRVQEGGRVGIHLMNISHDHKHVNHKEVRAVYTPMDQVESIELEKKMVKRKLKPRTGETDKYVDKNADLAKLPVQWREPFIQMLRKYQDVYARNHLDVGDCPVLPHEIRLTDPNQVVNIPPYRVPYHLMAVQHSYVDDLLAAGVIRPSNSPWSSPIMMVKKANADPNLPLASQFRMVHNYKKVNELIKPSSYPLTNLYQLIDEVASKKIYTVLDLSQGYFNQRCIDEQGATAFNVPGRGTFVYCRSPMGINSSPAAFQRLTEYILRGLKDTHVYLDDIIIASDTFAEHMRSVESVLARLRKYNLKINLRKAHFGHEETNYLGYKISHRSITPGERKVEAIRDSPVPKTLTQVRSFLGLCSFFRRTIPRFSEIAAPLTKLTRQDSGYNGGDLPPLALESFRALQRQLCAKPTIAPVDFSREFIVTVDTSGIAHGAVLSQSYGDEERINAYASSLLPPSKQRRPAFQLEKEGIRWALNHFRPYLMGKSFLIRTDHKPLLSLARGNVDVMDSVSADIQSFLPFRVQYLPGKKMPADFLSRPVMTTKVSDLLKESVEEKAPIGLITYGEGSMTLTASTLKQAQCADSYIKALACYLRFKAMPTNGLLRQYVMANRRSYRSGPLGMIEDHKGRVLIPPALKEEIMVRSHDEMGHRGTMASLANALRYYTWEGIREDMEDYCKSCKVCAKASPPWSYRNTKMKAYPPSTGFNQRIHLDCITGLRKSPTSGYTAILTITDSFSNYVQAEAIQSPLAEEIMRCFLDKWCKNHGFPHTIVTDGGKEFTSKGFEEICDRLQIKHHVTMAGVSRQNGRAERANRSLVHFLRTYVENHKFKIQDWELLLPSFCLTHNYSVQTNGFSPHFLVYGLQPNLNHLNPMPEIRRYTGSSWEQRLKMMYDARVAVNQYKAKKHDYNAKYYNKRVYTPKWKPGGLVYLNVGHDYGSKLNRKYVGPLILLRSTEQQAFVKVLRENSKPFWVHKDRLKVGYDRGALLSIPDEPIKEDLFGKLDSLFETQGGEVDIDPDNPEPNVEPDDEIPLEEDEDDDEGTEPQGHNEGPEEADEPQDEAEMTDASSEEDTWHDAGGSPQPNITTGARPKAPTPAPRRSLTPPTPAPRTRTPSTPGDTPKRSTRPVLEQLQKKQFKPFDPRKKKTPPSQLRFQPTVQLTPLGRQVGAKTRSKAGQLLEMVSDPEKILRKKRTKSPREGE